MRPVVRLLWPLVMRRTRLAKSSAKLNLRSEVTVWDAVFAIHLYEESLLLRTGRPYRLLCVTGEQLPCVAWDFGENANVYPSIGNVKGMKMLLSL